MKKTLVTAFAVLVAAVSARAYTSYSWNGTTATGGKYYWEDEGNWTVGSLQYNGHRFYSSTIGEGSRTITFKSAVSVADWFDFGNGTDAPIVFEAENATDGVTHTNDKFYIGNGGDGDGSLTVKSGIHTFLETRIGCKNGKTGILAVEGGNVTTGDAYVGYESGSVGTLAVKDGGVFSCGTATTEKRIRIGSEGSSITIGEGGRLEAWHIEATTAAAVSITLDGGTLASFGTGSQYCQYLIGDHGNKGYDSQLTVTVTAKGGTLDTQGKTVNIKNVAIGGEGTLKIVGGGTVTFEAKPTCAVLVEAGIVAVTAATTPANLAFGANGFVKFDLSSVSATTDENEETVLPAAQTLATGVTIAVPDGDTVAAHVIVKNDAVGDRNGHSATTLWQVSYADNTLTATAVSKDATPETTVWVGGYTTYYAPWQDTYKARWDGASNWTSGAPGESTTAIIPNATEIYIDGDTHNCGTLELRTTGTVRMWNQSQKASNTHFRPRSMTGAGTFKFGGFYLSTGSKGPAAAIDVPLLIEWTDHRDGFSAGTAKIQGGGADYPITLNKTVTVPENVPLVIGANVVINGDLTIDGTNTFTTVQEIKAGLSGSGIIKGSITTAAGATIRATVTGGSGVSPLATEHLTIDGSADLANAAVEIAGGANLADAEVGTEIVVLKATGEITNWTARSLEIAGKPGRSRSARRRRKLTTERAARRRRRTASSSASNRIPDLSSSSGEARHEKNDCRARCCDGGGCDPSRRAA